VTLNNLGIFLSETKTRRGQILTKWLLDVTWRKDTGGFERLRKTSSSKAKSLETVDAIVMSQKVGEAAHV
jgi:hypothetical protein